MSNNQQLELRSHMTAELIVAGGGDWLVCDAARVSSKGKQGVGPRDCRSRPKDIGLIESLYRQRHGTPFGHGSITFYVEAPMFVWWEWRTHKIAVVLTTDDISYSSQSARYREFDPIFWIPDRDRPSHPAPEFKPMQPEFVTPTPAQYRTMCEDLESAYSVGWFLYQKMLDDGVAREVARAAIPPAIYYAAYVSFNPRSLMHFLSLRNRAPNAIFDTRPQFEIEACAKLTEDIFAQGWPVTYGAFNEHGRYGV